MLKGKTRNAENLLEPKTVLAQPLIASLSASANKVNSSSPGLPISSRTRNSPYLKRKSSRVKSTVQDADSARPVSPTEERYTSVFDDEQGSRTSDVAIPQSPRVLPFAHAVLSPVAQSKIQRKLSKLAREDKVAIAFDMEEFTDTKSKINNVSLSDEEAINPIKTLPLPLEEPTTLEDRHLKAVGAGIFRAILLLVAFVVSGSFFYASKNYSEENGIMAFMADPRRLKASVRAYTKEHLDSLKETLENWNFDAFNTIPAFFTAPAALDLGPYSVQTNDLFQFTPTIREDMLSVTTNLATHSQALSISRQLLSKSRKWKHSGRHAPLNPNFKVVTLADTVQEEEDVALVTEASRVARLVSDMRTHMFTASQAANPLKCTLLSVAEDIIPACDTLKLLLDPVLMSVQETADSIRVVADDMHAPIVHIEHQSLPPNPLFVRLLEVSVGPVVQVPLAASEGTEVLHFNEEGLQLRTFAAPILA